MQLERSRSYTCNNVAPVSISTYGNWHVTLALSWNLSLSIAELCLCYCQAIVPSLYLVCGCFESKLRVTLFIHIKLHDIRFNLSLQLLRALLFWFMAVHLVLPKYLIGALWWGQKLLWADLSPALDLYL